MGQRWCLAQLKPKGLDLAVRNLTRQGFDVFCPRQRLTKRCGVRYREREVPLYPGYIFVEISEANVPWRRIDSTLGVARLVRFQGDSPALVPCELIAALTARCDENELLWSTASLQPGARAEVLRGPFAGYISQVEWLEADQRVWLLLDLMGRAARVAVSAGDLAAA